MARAVVRAVHRRAHPAGLSRVGTVAGREVALQVVIGRVRLAIRQAVGVAMRHRAEVDDDSRRLGYAGRGKWEAG